MSILASFRFCAAFALTLAMMFVISAHGQTPASSPGSLEREVAGVKAENAALREQLRNLEEQQKAMLSLMQQLQRRLDGTPAAAAQEQTAAQPPSPVVAATAAFDDGPGILGGAGRCPAGSRAVRGWTTVRARLSQLDGPPGRQV